MSNNKEVKSTPQGIEVPADKLMSVILERSISDKDQTIGAHKQTIQYQAAQITDLKAKLVIEKENKPLVADDQKVAVISGSSPNGRKCPHCGYLNNSNRYCYECEFDLKGIKKGSDLIEYRNLDDVIADIRKEESKNLKLNNVELEKQLNDTEFKLNKVTNTLKNVESTQVQDLTDAKRDVRERYQKELKENEKEYTKVIDANETKIDELVEEINKLEENKTDAEVEEARKQEIIDLKTQVTELESVIDEAKEASTPRMKKFWKRVADRKEVRKLEEEKEAKHNRVDEISNRYPNNTVKTTPWWKKGKYAKNTKEAISDAKEARRSTNWFHPW